MNHLQVRFTLLLALLSLPAAAQVSVSTIEASRKSAGKVNVTFIRAPLKASLARLSTAMKRPVRLDAPDRMITFHASDVEPSQALALLVERQKLKLGAEGTTVVVTDPTPEFTVTMDVTDTDIRTILKSMQRQCRVRNMVVDPEVKGSGTFLFNAVPCSIAFRTVFNSLGLSGDFEPNSVVQVRGARQ